MKMFNQGNGNMEVEIDACDIKRPRKTAPRRMWLAGMFVALFLVTDYGFGETGSEEITRQDASSDEREQAAEALFNEGVTLWQQGKIEEAFAVYEEIDRRFGQDASPDVRKCVASALFNKGVTLWQQGKSEEALAVYEEVDRRFGEDASPGVRRWGVMALVNKAITLFESHNDAAGALAVLDPVLARCDNSFELALEAPCFRALENSVEPLIVLEKTHDAAQRIRLAQVQLDADDGENAIMTFLLWLAVPQISEQPVREAIRALPPDAQFRWTFNGIRPFVLNLPAPRKARAQCFLDFFEQHHDTEKLDVCLDETGSLP